MLNEVELIKDILDLQNVVMFLQAQLQEARKMSDAQGPNMSRAWLDDIGARLEQIKREELAAVPSYCERFCNPLIIINEQGEEMHTTDHPFCADMRCECHTDSWRWQMYIYQPWLDGILTMGAAAALFSGKQV